MSGKTLFARGLQQQFFDSHHLRLTILQGIFFLHSTIQTWYYKKFVTRGGSIQDESLLYAMGVSASADNDID